MEWVFSLLYSHITHILLRLSKIHIQVLRKLWGTEGRNLTERCLVGHSVSLEGLYPRYDLVY